MIDVAGERIAQADAILRLAGTLAGLNPADPVQQAKVDQWTALENDFSYPFTMALFPEKCYLTAWAPGARSCCRIPLDVPHTCAPRNGKKKVVAVAYDVAACVRRA